MITFNEVHQSWRSIDSMPASLKRSVIGSEDQNFCAHHGFDWEDIELAMKERASGKRHRGASTISQQVARTVFLTPARNWVRKGAEAYFTVLVEFVWPKKRILEAYLNLVDLGHGNYGAEAASQAYFRVPVSALTPAQAARLVSILPNPDKWKANRAGKRRLNRAFARTQEATENGMDWCVR
jgi:monofunctional glycosyltransferase